MSDTLVEIGFLPPHLKRPQRSQGSRNDLEACHLPTRSSGTFHLRLIDVEIFLRCVKKTKTCVRQRVGPVHGNY